MTTKLTPEQVEKLEAAAEKATKGPYRHFKGATVDSVMLREDNMVEVIHWTGFDSSQVSKQQRRANAAYFANCDPDTILTLCREWREMRSALVKLREIGENGVPDSYNEWLSSHQKIAQIAAAAIKGTADAALKGADRE